MENRRNKLILEGLRGFSQAIDSIEGFESKEKSDTKVSQKRCTERVVINGNIWYTDT